MAKLSKAENPQRYKEYAQTGVMVAYSVTIAGVDVRPDNGIHYHSTIKFFDPTKDHVHEVNNIAKELTLNPPNPKTVGIESGMFVDRNGDDVYVIKMNGSDADRIKEENQRFSHMGYPATFDFKPHISVDKATHDKIKESGAKTAQEADIKFGPAELRQGSNVLAVYRHPMIDNTPIEQHDPIVPLNPQNGNDLNKNAIKSAVTGAAMLGASLAHSTAASAPMNQHGDSYNHDKMLRAIAQVESSGGKNINHKALKTGAHAYGKYGITPALAQETIRMSPDLKSRHQKALALTGDTVNKYLQDNPGLEDKIADRHLSRLEHHFGHDPQSIGYAWLEGISGTNKAKKEGKDIGSHWHVAKVRDAYSKDSK